MVLWPLPPRMTCLALVFTEFARIWASASYYLSQRLALHQVGPTSSSPPHILMKVDEVLCYGVRLFSPSSESRNAPARRCKAQMRTDHLLCPFRSTIKVQE